jgi:hypothetical protein
MPEQSASNLSGKHDDNQKQENKAAKHEADINHQCL